MLESVKARIKNAVPRARWERARMRWWQLTRAVTVDHSALPLPWFAASCPANILETHRLASRLDWQYAPTLESRACLWITSLCWPVVSLLHVAVEWRKNATFVAQAFGISRPRQALQMAWLTNRYNCPASSYYKFGLFDQGNAGRVLQYVHHYEICNLLPELNKNRPIQLLGDKQAFYEEATRHDLPIAPIVAAFESGAVLKWHSDPENRLPESDLVLKAFDLSCGARFERWSYSGRGAWSSDGETLDEGRLLDRCRLRSLDHGCLVQKRLVNHPDIAGLGPNGLCTVRVVTYRRPAGHPAILMVCLRMPTAGGIVDNFAAGGIAAPVDPHAGTVGEAVAKTLSRGTFRSHPDSRAPIAGAQLPLWEQTRGLALDAHRCFDWMPFVGWDIAVTPDGPLLLEANPVWCVDLLQIPHHVALGDTEFVSVFLQHLEGSADRACPDNGGRVPADTRR